MQRPPWQLPTGEMMEVQARVTCGDGKDGKEWRTLCSVRWELSLRVERGWK